MKKSIFLNFIPIFHSKSHINSWRKFRLDDVSSQGRNTPPRVSGVFKFFFSKLNIRLCCIHLKFLWNKNISKFQTWNNEAGFPVSSSRKLDGTPTRALRIRPPLLHHMVYRGDLLLFWGYGTLLSTIRKSFDCGSYVKNPIPSHCGELLGGFFCGGSFQPGKLLP